MNRFSSRVLACGAGVAMAAMALGLTGCASQAASSTSTDPGAVVLEQHCTVCHTADRINSATKDADGWNATIDRMRGKGAVVSEQEQKDLVDYLLSK